MTPERNRALLTAIAAEVTDVADGVEALSGLLNRLISADRVLDRADALRQAQAVDGLVQRCRALGDVAAGVAGGRDLDALLDAAPLADLADRLRASGTREPGCDHRPDIRPAPGDVHLFD